MSYLEKIQRCNRRDMRRFVPFRAGPVQVGWIARHRLDVLARFPKVFTVRSDGVAFARALSTPARRSKALADIAGALVESVAFPRLRSELYGVRNSWSEPAHFRIDRGLVQGFGVRAYGVHLNGVVRRNDHLHLWIGTRSPDVRVEPGKLDNMVGGGQPAHLTLTANLVKECAEEAHLPARIARRARFVSTITYAFETPDGLKMDTLYNYDLALRAREVPKPSEEITGFQLMPVGRALSLIRNTDRFKFNVNLVVLDFAIRHGLVTPENERNFDAIIGGLHEKPQMVGAPGAGHR